jgi:Zn-dependent protease/CBS domain-containing protein
MQYKLGGMKWSLRIGRFFGIDAYVHFTFLLILVFVAVSHWVAYHTFGAVAEGVLFFCALFACVLMHEYGHALMAMRFGIRTQDIVLFPFGGVARLENMPDRPTQELWIAVAGPAVNVVIALGLGALLLLLGQPPVSLGLEGAEDGFFQRLVLVNLVLVGFNLLPAFPMDGGRVLRAVLAMRIEYVRATKIAVTLGQGMALLFGLVGLFFNPFLILIAFFVWIAASDELGFAQMRAALGAVRVRDAMLTQFELLSPADTMETAVNKIIRGAQEDFPVVEHGQLLGILTRQDMLLALAQQGMDVSVGSVMRTDYPCLEADAILNAAEQGVQLRECPTLPVLLRGRLVGLLTLQNLSEVMMIRSALRGHAP